MKHFFVLLIILCLIFPFRVLALMSSTNYTIFADSFDSGGGYSVSGTYALEDTFGEIPGIISSSTYTIRGGYQAMDWDYIGLSFSSSSLNLGVASTTAVKSASTTVTVTTDHPDGYDLTVSAESGTSLTDVSDGAVTIGVEEYGVAVSGSNASFANDRGIAAGLNLASTTQSVTGVTTTLTFKAAISGSTAFAVYTHTITIIAANKL
ncbi:hypothetical protein EPN28_00240 [Patescibacteria group bacterium]|nr:MAG: hypothetical protein EPN28_00240 [Patescibacteria group bacterium]